MIKLANRALLKSAKELKTHRQRQPARFERILELQGKYVRYFSDEPAVLFGEFVLDKLKENGDPMGRLIFVQRLDESHWYFAEYLDGLLVRENTGLLDHLYQQFSYSLRDCSNVIATDKAFHGIFNNENIVFVSPMPLDELESYTIQAKQNTRIDIKWFVAAIILVLGISIGFALYPKPEPVKKVVIDDSKTIYSRTHASHSNAKDALLSSLNLLVDASLMPSGMEATKVVLSGQTLTMPITENDIAPSIKNAWLESVPGIKSVYSDSNVMFLLTPPDKWQPYEIKGYIEHVQDALFYMGGTLKRESEQFVEGYKIGTYQLKFAGQAGQVSVIAELLDEPFVTVSFLEMEMTTDYQINNLNMTLNVQGEPL